MANVGLHYTRNVTTETVGQFVKNVKVYRANTATKNVYQQFKSKEDESFCFIKKSCVQHWCLMGVPSKFLVIAKNAWDPHPVNVTNISATGNNYIVLAENDRGCMIVEHKNTISTLFHIDSKFPETTLIVENFVKHKMMLIQVNFCFVYPT